MSSIIQSRSFDFMDSFKHNVPTLGAGQKTFQQCWFASYKMLFKFNGRPADEIETRLRGLMKTDVMGNDRFNDALANGLLDTDYWTASTALGLKSLGGAAFNKPAGFFDVGLSDGAEAFVNELKKGPLWVSRFTGAGYHIVIATGYNDNGKGYIIYNNPFPGPSNAVEVTTETANTFVKFITNAKGSVQGKRN
jgi:hypothetical protein